MLTLTDEQLDWLLERIPDPPKSPKGGRPPAEKRKVVQGIFWILDNGAKWKDLPRKFGSKSTVHRWFQTWVKQGLFETIMRDAGHLVEERDGYRLYECFIDGTFSKARGGGDGIGHGPGAPAAQDRQPARVPKPGCPECWDLPAVR